MSATAISPPARPTMFSPTVIIALLSVYIVWGSTYLGIAWAIESIPPLLMAGTRFLLAGTAMFLWCLSRGETMPTRQQWRAAALMGLLMMAGGNGLVTIAEQWMPSGVAAIMIATVPLFALIFGHLVNRQPAHWLEWSGIVTGFAGIVLLNSEKTLLAQPLGIFLLLSAAACWALGTVIGKRLPLANGMMGSATQMLMGGALMLIFGFTRGERLHAIPTTHSILAMLYLAVFGSILAYSAYSYLMRNVRPALATSYAYVNPMVAVTLGVVLNNEHVSPKMGFAMLIILGAVGMVMLAQRLHHQGK
ncbi:drug/metabolite exporter YedA [Leeia sp. TBRC 13508]|uniref:Drug/metabolite exporter YedA n=1 Tax=Leeia speluncae TaxID=2884804 RepID=A0ABS8D483_9NEIS|nr:drug/metabolite exporter YedA [Leeia speluncae]MCB6182987.1 drug/metabolite exporter YedA [Leeia speluncae]